MVTRKFCPRPFLHLDYHIADYYHPLTSHCFCGIMEKDTFATNYGRLLPKCQILLTNVENCGTIMVEEYTLMCGQTTRGGYLCAGGGHPDYYAYEAAAGSRTSCSSRIISTQTTSAVVPGRQTIMCAPIPDYHMRAYSRTKGEVAARLHYVSHKQ